MNNEQSSHTSYLTPHTCYLILLFAFCLNVVFAQKEIQTEYPVRIAVSDEMMKILQETKTSQYAVNNTIPLQNFNLLTKKALTNLENRGFPFVSIFLDDIVEQNDTVLQISSLIKIFSARLIR